MKKPKYISPKYNPIKIESPILTIEKNNTTMRMKIIFAKITAINMEILSVIFNSMSAMLDFP
jgi:hypothetical protein